MGRELTKRHSMMFEKKLMNPIAFIRDIYQYEKHRELLSFLIWEIFHRLGLFPKHKYLQFTTDDALALNNVKVNSPEFQADINTFFAGKGMRLERLEPEWKLMTFNQQDVLFGCMYPDDKQLFKSNDYGKSAIKIATFPSSIKSIYISNQGTIFVCSKGAVYRSIDQGEIFNKVLQMGSDESFFRHNNEMTETPDGTLIIGEYGNVWNGTRWQVLAYIYLSNDDGLTWETCDFLFGKGVNKHVHLVKYSKLFNKVYMADGDNYKKVWETDALTFSELRDAQRWKPINRFHIQMGGYTSVIEDDKQLLFGTDYQGGTNFMVSTTDGKTFTKTVVPDPYRRSPIDNMVQRRSKNGNEIWANLPYSASKTKSLLMFTTDGGKNWQKLLEYQGPDHKVWLLNSSYQITNNLYLSIMDLKNKTRLVFRVTDK